MTAIWFPLTHCTAVAVRSDQQGAPTETKVQGTGLPPVLLQKPSRTAGEAWSSCRLSVTPEHPAEREDAGLGPSKHFSPPPCD